MTVLGSRSKEWDDNLCEPYPICPYVSINEYKVCFSKHLPI